MSSRISECTRRWALLWRVLSKRYVGRERRVAIVEAQDEGWKIWTWSRLSDVSVRMVVLTEAESVGSGTPSKVVRMCRITVARRGTLKCRRGSKRMTVDSRPLREGIEGCFAGRMAWAMIR
jgi:hypothetical protein